MSFCCCCQHRNAKIDSELSQPVADVVGIDYNSNENQNNQNNAIPWKNIAYDVFKEHCGEDAFNRKIEEGEKAPENPGMFSKAQLKMETGKYKMLFGAISLACQRRATHKLGVGGLGTATVVSAPQFPANEFFKPNRAFPVRLRHGNLNLDDDAGSDVRGASLKFADTDDESPLDLIMNTGSVCVFWDVKSLDNLTIAKSKGEEGIKDYVLMDPLYYHNLVEGRRRAPLSYTDLHYYSQLVFDFTALDGSKRYVKYRLVPADGRPESGRLDQNDQRQIWNAVRLAGESRPEDYLKQEFESRITKGSVQYKLQIQLHQPSPNDHPQLLHAGRAWDEKSHPWLDLMDISITTELPFDVLERTRYNISNQHSSLGILPAKSIYDYNSIAFIRSQVYKFAQKIRSINPAEENPDKVNNYYITVKTGDRKGAGTDANVTITLTGSEGRTRAIKLDKWFHDDFEAGQIDEYVVNDADVGEILLVQLDNDGKGLKSDWFVDYVTILSSSHGKCYTFPCYRWVSSQIIIYQQRALLPMDEQHEVIQSQRKLEIQERQKHYLWSAAVGMEDLPGYIEAPVHNDLPKDVQFSDEASRSFEQGRLRGITNLGLSLLINSLDKWEDFDDFKKAFTSLIDPPKIADDNRWKEDRVFGSHFLNGCNPCSLQRCEELPENFPVTEDHVRNCLDRGLTLEQEMKEGHIYIVNYKILEGLTIFENRYICQPFGLLYLNKSGDLVPIAIQFFQTPSEQNPIWTPNDSEYDWLLAKMWLRNADISVHQMIIHLALTHLSMEPVGVATWRNLPLLHPLFKLLCPHVRSVMAINTLGRMELIVEGGITEKTLGVGGAHIQLIQKYYKSHLTWDAFDLPSSLKKRGVDDPEKLPSYYYRDDALRLWQAIKEFIGSYVSFYYVTDDNVSSDFELQSWVQDLHDNGFPVREGDIDHGFPSSLSSRGELVEMLTRILFTCSCQHAAVNFPQMSMYSFIPNYPNIMCQQPPTEKGVVDQKFIMETLPTKRMTGWQIATVYTLTQFADDERFLGDYTEHNFDEAVYPVLEKFQNKLQEISDAIKIRNESLEEPYIHLLPERIPSSVAI